MKIVFWIFFWCQCCACMWRILVLWISKFSLFQWNHECRSVAKATAAIRSIIWFLRSSLPIRCAGNFGENINHFVKEAEKIEKVFWNQAPIPFFLNYVIICQVTSNTSCYMPLKLKNFGKKKTCSSAFLIAHRFIYASKTILTFRQLHEFLTENLIFIFLYKL